MVMLDLTIVNIALPSMQRELHFSSTSLTWVIDAYVLAFGGLLVLGGRAGDFFGRRRMFVVGVALFAAASLAGGLASDQAMLVVARAVQGVGAAVASPTALSLVATTFDEGAERNRAMAVYAGMSAAGGALGLLLGGILVDIASWRWVLFVNVPIGALVLALSPVALPIGAQRRRSGDRLDVPGALGASAATTLLVYGLIRASDAGWSSTGTIASFVAAAAVLAALVAFESRATSPLVPLGFLRDRNRATGYGMMLLLGAAMLSLIFFLTQLLQDVLHYSPIRAGAAYLPIPTGVALTSVVVSRLLGRIPLRAFLTLGPLLVTGGLYWVSQISAGSRYGNILPPLVLIGVGMGLSFMPLTLNAVASVRGDDSGLASALLATSQQVGGSLGLAALVTVSTAAARDQLHLLLRSTDVALTPARVRALRVAAGVHGVDMAIRAGALATVLAFALALLLRTRGPAALPDAAGGHERRETVRLRSARPDRATPTGGRSR